MSRRSVIKRGKLRRIRRYTATVLLSKATPSLYEIRKVLFHRRADGSLMASIGDIATCRFVKIVYPAWVMGGFRPLPCLIHRK